MYHWKTKNTSQKWIEAAERAMTVTIPSNPNTLSAQSCCLYHWSYQLTWAVRTYDAWIHEHVQAANRFVHVPWILDFQDLPRLSRYAISTPEEVHITCTTACWRSKMLKEPLTVNWELRTRDYARSKGRLRCRHRGPHRTKKKYIARWSEDVIISFVDSIEFIWISHLFRVQLVK